MKKNILFASMVLSSVFASAQITVDNTTMTPTQLVQDVLVGTGVTVSNVMWNGSLADALIVQPQSGTFTGTSTAGIPYGVLLGSGDVTEAIGPNVGGGTTLGGSGMSGTDPDLQSIASSGINDEAVLEFDFIPQGDSIKFQYVFASEEYPEYVCSGFNDVFGFFITGPNPFGPAYSATNIALIPGSGGLPVTINSVNPGVPGSSSGGGTCTSLAYSMYYINNLGGLTIEYDGLTTVLTAQAAVECGQTYHIKLAISDVGDFAFDSGVFLQAGSFSSNAVDVTITTPTSAGFVDGSIYENCILGTSATFYLVRPDFSNADTIPFSFSGTAVLGADYTSSTPDTFAVFAAGEDSAAFGVSILNDGITEGVDSLVVTVYNINPCGDTILSTGTLYIHDPLIIDTYVADDTIHCAGEPITLTGTVSGSPLDFTYSWTGPGLSASTLSTTYNPPGPVSVIFTATDECGFTGSDTMQVYVIPVPLFANAGPDQSVLCPGNSINLNGSGSGGTGSLNYLWSYGGGMISNLASTPFTPTSTQFVFFTVTDDCGQLDTDTMKVTVPTIAPYNLTYDPTQNVTCPGDPVNLSVVVNSGGTGSPYTYLWDNSATTASTTYNVNTSPTTANLVITDNCGLDTTISYTLTITSFPPLIVTSTDGTICRGLDNTISLPISTSGGAGVNNFVWSGPSGSSTVHDYTFGAGIVTNPITGNYIVVVTDQCGNADADTSDITVIPCEITIPNIVTPNGDGINDVVHIENLEYHPNSSFVLFNRWGQVKYENGNYQNDYNPSDLTDGVYFYILKLTDGTSPSDYTGTIQVTNK